MIRTLLAITLLATLSFTLSCRDANNEPITPVEKKEDVSFTLKADNLNSLQVGDRLKVSIDISDKDTLNAQYTITPKTENAVFHQIIGKDYKLYVFDDALGAYINTKEIKLSPKKLKSNFYIEILQPGSFQHEYQVEKIVNGKSVAKVNKEFSFNAVKITAWTYAEQVVPPGTWNRSEHRRYYKFIIDDGNEKFDNFLTTTDSKTHTYEVTYAGDKYTEERGDFSANVEKEFRESRQTKITPEKVPSTILEEIRIQQKYGNLINNFTYKDIPVILK